MGHFSRVRTWRTPICHSIWGGCGVACQEKFRNVWGSGKMSCSVASRIECISWEVQKQMGNYSYVSAACIWSLSGRFRAVQPTCFFPSRFKRNGGVVIHRKVNSFDEVIPKSLSLLLWLLPKRRRRDFSHQNFGHCKNSFFQQLCHYDMIVNCSGFGSRQLQNDDKMFAVRGHLIRVSASTLLFHVRVLQMHFLRRKVNQNVKWF